MSQKIQIRRGVEAQRAAVIPDAGELLFTTDDHELFVGDGATAGGLFVGGGTGVGFVQKYRGTQAIAAGADSVTVSGLTLPSAPVQVLVSMRKATGGANLFGDGAGRFDLDGGIYRGPVGHHGFEHVCVGLPGDFMSATWTIIDANGMQKAVADWGLSAVTRERINQAPDMVTFRAAATLCDADPIFAHGSTIRLLRDGVPWFYGRVISVPGRAAAKVEEQFYRVAGPWWYLENLVFQQAWQTTNGIVTTLIATNKSRLILGQAADGTKLATGAAIAEVLAYATARGVPITVGTISPDALAPYAEALDRSCAEVIRNLLRWTPDAMTAFDYTTTPYPTLTIRRRAGSPLLSLPAYGAPMTGLDLTPRHDLQAPAVVLKFEQTNDIDNDTFTSLTVQSAPTSATGDEFGALVMTLDLAGARATYQKQPVTVVEIPQSDTASGVIDWWKGKFAWLGDFADSDLSVVSGTQSVTIENPTAYPGLEVSDVPNELLTGSIAAWMNLNAAPLLVSATLKFSRHGDG